LTLVTLRLAAQPGMGAWPGEGGSSRTRLLVMPAVNDKYCSAYLTPLVLRTLIAGERRSSAARANPH